MRPGGGKQKGASFEREVCVMLSRWLTNDQQEDVFWRSAMSGGRATVAHKKGGKRLASQVGDISCIHAIGNRFIDAFAPECKFYADLEYKGLLTGRGKLVAFWEEINEQASRYGKHPFLVARQNRMPAHVCLSKAGLTELGLKDFNTVLISIPIDMYILEAEDFVRACKPYVAIGRGSPFHRSRKRLIPV